MSPILREEIKSPLSPFRYKDELEKALNDFRFGNMFMYGAQKVGGRMKHQKEWHTCDRCGKEIIPKSWNKVRFKKVGMCGDIVPAFEDNDMCLEIKNVRRYE